MQSGPLDVTLEAPSPAASTNDSRSGPKVHLVEGSSVGLSSELQGVLRQRLKIASLVLLAGFAVFFVWRLAFTMLGTDVDRVSETMVYTTLAAHLVVTGILAANGVHFCRQCPTTSQHLRFKEALIFGAPAAFFLLLQAAQAPYFAEKNGVLPPASPPWMVLIFCYAMFIPNTWRRAAVVIGAMALAPVILLTVVSQWSPACHGALAKDWSQLFEIALLMPIVGLTATVGVHTINTLRYEAFQAKQLGQYRLGRQLGAGGMGEVYLAEHLLMKRPCAIKIIRPEKAGDPRALARFEREVRATARLTHWNSIEIFDYGRSDDGAFYYVMEYLPGLNLAELVRRFGPLPPERVIHLLRQTCDALAEAHDVGLVHRDIKPANIFAAVRGGVYDVAKLLDFGLAKPIVAEGDDPHLTQEGFLTGSPLFMAPEQADGGEPDARSDIYSLGIVAYFLLSGQVPFAGERAMQVLIAHLRDRPRPLHELVEQVPADLEAVVMRCLEKRPEDRYPSAHALREALERCEHAGRWTAGDAAAWWGANVRRDAPELEPCAV